MKKYLIVCLLGLLSIGCGGVKDGNPADVLPKKTYMECIDKYNDIYDFKNGYAKVMRVENDEVGTFLFGVINHKGEEVIPCDYTELYIEDGVELVQVSIKNRKGDRLFGLLNYNGDTVLPIKYESIGGFHDGLAWIIEDTDTMSTKESDRKYGYINTKGEIVITPQYDGANNFSCGLSVVERLKANWKWYYLDREYAVINTNGEVIVPFGKYDYIHSYSDDMAKIKKGGKYGYIDKKGEIAIIPRYKEISNFHEGLAFANETESVCVIIDKTGDEKGSLPVHIHPVGNFSAGMAVVAKEGFDEEFEGYGYVNTEGEIIIPCKYDGCLSFHPKIKYTVVIKKSGKAVVIDKKGEEVDMSPGELELLIEEKLGQKEALDFYAENAFD